MKNILIVGMSKNPGGVETFLMNYLGNMNVEDMSIDFLIFSKECAFEDTVKQQFGNIISITTAQIKNRAVYKKKIDKLFCNKHYDTLWFNANDLANAIILKYAKKYKVNRIIVHAHNSETMGSGLKKIIYDILHNHYKKRINKYADYCWACSNLAARYFYPDEVVMSDKFRIIKNAVDLKKFQFKQNERKETRAELGINNDEILIGHVGRFHYQKNQEFVLEIFSALLKRNDKYKLILVGDGKDKENIIRRISELAISDKVILTGAVNETEKYYSAMDYFVFPSRFEGLGIVLLEAQAEGLPIFTSDVIPKEVEVTDLCNFLSLDLSADAWANKISEISRCDNRSIYADQVSKSGYDITDCAESVHGILVGN